MKSLYAEVVIIPYRPTCTEILQSIKFPYMLMKYFHFLLSLNGASIWIVNIRALVIDGSTILPHCKVEHAWCINACTGNLMVLTLHFEDLALGNLSQSIFSSWIQNGVLHLSAQTSSNPSLTQRTKNFNFSYQKNTTLYNIVSLLRSPMPSWNWKTNF